MKGGSSDPLTQTFLEIETIIQLKILVSAWSIVP